MTPERAEAAADRLRALDYEQEHSPLTFDARATAKEAAECLEVITSFLAGVPEGMKGVLARSLAERVLGRAIQQGGNQ